MRTEDRPVNYFMIGVISVIIVIILVAAWGNAKASARAAATEEARLAAMSPEETKEYLEGKAKFAAYEKRMAIEREAEQSARWVHGPVNSQLICPHCQTKGKVRTKEIERKAGVSGGKATAAILTGGLSMLATGLSRKEQLTQAYCCNCRSIWAF
jgi:hypothetical protein